ncbi:hypothetical protein SAMN05216486_10217 [bacterium JGI 053]|nr:hypothetical protein SAMN05216486_10217 [bacterium JGI 053]
MGWMLFMLIGLGAGVLSGLFGIGGGVVIVPALIFIARMQPQSAMGTSLTALLLPVGALGAWEYYRTGNLNLGAGLLVALGLFAGAGVGAKLSLQLSPAGLRRAFAVFLALIAVRMWFSGDDARAHAAVPPPVVDTPAP